MAIIKTDVRDSAAHIALFVVAGVIVLLSVAAGRPIAKARWTSGSPLQLATGSPCSSIGSSGRAVNVTSIADTVGDVRFCFWTDDGSSTLSARPSEVVRGTGQFLLETILNSGPSLRMSRMADNGGRVVWHVNGTERPLDRAAEMWRDRLLEVVDTTYEIFSLKGQVASLEGAIAATRGQRASLQGEIASLRGQVASFQGEIASVEGQRAALKGRIASLQGELVSTRVSISAERSAIANLSSARRVMSSVAGRDQIDAEIAAREERVRALDAQALSFDTNTKIKAIEQDIIAMDADSRIADLRREIEAFDLPGKIAEVERRIQALNVDTKVTDLERQIRDLNADMRLPQLRTRRATAIERLETAIRAIK
jgi:predicted  nucleic acid-binding Zn-ribbon protein